jgi:surfeit locus 1 family protein
MNLFVRRLQHYRFDWKLSLLTVALLPVLLNLGFWQLRREEEKRALQLQYEQRLALAPRPFETLDWSADLQYLPVLLSGEADPSHVFLLDNRTLQGRAGFEVLQPVRTAEGAIVFLNRGWLAAGPSRREPPSPPAMPAVAALVTSVYQSTGAPLLLGEEQENSGWPRIVQSVDVSAMALASGYAGAQVFPHLLRLDQHAVGALPRLWSTVTTSPEKHRGYALQWFSMSLALLLLYAYYSTRPEDGQPAD